MNTANGFGSSPAFQRADGTPLIDVGNTRLKWRWLDGTAPCTTAGVDGTLRRAKTRANGFAHLKTGSLRDVTGVAGYVHSASGRRWVLVAIANHPNAGAMRPVIDQLVEWTAREP